MNGKELIKIIKDNNLLNKDICILVSDSLHVAARNITGWELSCPEDNCLFLNVNMRPLGKFDGKCEGCWIFNHPEVYPGPLDCWRSDICKKKRHEKPTKKDLKLHDKICLDHEATND